MSNTYSPSLGLPSQCKEWKNILIALGEATFTIWKNSHELSSHEWILISKTLTKDKNESI